MFENKRKKQKNTVMIEYDKLVKKKIENSASMIIKMKIF